MVVTDTESGGEDAVFADATSQSDTGAGAISRRKRQFSVPEMVARAESRKSKRPAVSRLSKSPRETAPPRKAGEAADVSASVELSDAAMSRIQKMLDGGIATVIAAFEAKFESMQRKIDVLEGEVMDRDVEIRSLQEQLERQGQALEDLQERTEGIDLNRRLSMLILTCDDFISKTTDEDVEQKVVQVLNRRFQWLNMSSADIQAAHRLQANNKVVVRFVKRRVRDAVYDGRFELFNTGGRGTRGMSDLFITESLTPKNREIYSRLLEARKPANGGRIASVFSRRGVVFCRLEKKGSNIRVPDLQQMQRILSGEHESRGVRGPRPGAAPARPSGGSGPSSGGPGPSAGGSGPSAGGSGASVGGPGPSAGGSDASSGGPGPSSGGARPPPPAAAVVGRSGGGERAGGPDRRESAAPPSSASVPGLREAAGGRGPPGAVSASGSGAGAGTGSAVGSGAEAAAGAGVKQVSSLLIRGEALSTV